MLFFKNFNRQMRFLTHQDITALYGGDLTTKSIGEEPNRLLFIFPARM
jgi:hypothetical protein